MLTSPVITHGVHPGVIHKGDKSMKTRGNRHIAGLSLALVMIAAAALGACGSDEEAEAPAEDAATETTEAAAEEVSPVDAWFADVKAQYDGTTVSLLMASHPGTTAFQKTIGRFQEATGITVQFDVVEEGAMIEKQIAECGSSSDIYDIYMVAVEGVTRMTQTECISPLNDWVAGLPEWYDFEDLMPAYRDLFTVNDSFNAVPFAGESIFLFYRQDLFDKHGKTPPKTWDELRELAKFFKETEGIAGVTFRARQGWEFTYGYSGFLFPFGGQIVDGKTSSECPKSKPSGCPPAINVPGSVAALDYMISLKEFAPVGIESFSFPEAWQSFMTGNAAMMVEATAAAGEVENPDKSMVAGKTGYTVLPAGPAGAYTGVWGWGLGVNKASKNAGAAAAVITWLTSRENSQGYVDAGGIPGRQSDFDSAENQAKYPFYRAIGAALAQANDLAKTGNGAVPKARIWVAWSDSIGLHGGEAFAGKITSAEAVKRMQADMEAALQG